MSVSLPRSAIGWSAVLFWYFLIILSYFFVAFFSHIFTNGPNFVCFTSVNKKKSFKFV